MEPETLLITAVTTLAGVVVTLAGTIAIIAKWVKTNVVEPVVKSHLELVETLKQDLPEQTKQMQDQTKVLVTIAKVQKRIEVQSGEHLTMQKEEMEQLAAIRAALAKP